MEDVPRKRQQIIITDADVNRIISKETGFDRIRQLFATRSSSRWSDELEFIGSVTAHTGSVIFLVMSVIGGRSAKEKFLEKNKHKTYETKFQAIRSYNDAILFGALRNGLKYGFKGAFFTATFLLTSQLISSYRNKTGLIEYVVAGGLTCSLLRSSAGAYAMLAGGVIGGGLGLLGGGCFCALLYSSNMSQQQRHFIKIYEELREKKEEELLLSS